MESLWILIPLSLVIAIVIGWVFWWAVTDGQLDDLDAPAQRILIDDDRPRTASNVGSTPADRAPLPATSDDKTRTETQLPLI